MFEHPPGWTCGRTVVQFENYFASSLERAQALCIAEHLEACPGCTHRLVLFRMTISRPDRD
jgi:proline dehydrogenase